jgi:sugar-specific transcriptional regulator TrmB
VKPAPNDRVYQIRSRDQALHRTAQLIGSASQSILLVCSPAILETLMEPLLEANARNVHVLVKSDGILESPELELHSFPDAEPFLHSKIENDLRLCVDAKHAFIGLAETSAENPVALVSESELLCRTLHIALLSEITLAAVSRKVHEDAGQKRLLRALNVFRNQA